MNPSDNNQESASDDAWTAPAPPQTEKWLMIAARAAMTPLPPLEEPADDSPQLVTGKTTRASRATKLTSAVVLVLGLFVAGGAAGIVFCTERVETFADVMRTAAGIIGHDSGEIWVAVDCPAYGNASHPEVFVEYRKALELRAGSGAKTHILWYSDADEQRYIQEKARAPETPILVNARAVRELAAHAENWDVAEIAAPKLDDFQLFIWRDGNQSEVLMTFVEKTEVPARVRAIHYKNANDFADTLIDLFQVLEQSRDRDGATDQAPQK